MSRIALNLKEFKHVCGDDKSTTLEHKDGHQLVLAHKVLSKEAQEQLKALSKVESKSSSKAKAKDEPKQAAEKTEEKPIAKMAEGGEVEAPPAVKPYEQMNDEERAALSERLKVQQSGVNMDQVQPDSILGAPAQEAAPVAAAPQGIAPQAAASQAEPTIPDGPTGLIPDAPAAQDLGSQYQSGVQSQMAGLQEEAKAKDQLSKDVVDQRQQQIEAQTLAQEQFKQDTAHLESERQALMQDIKDGHVDPEKYWQNHSKLAAGIGMIIAGFNPTNSPNAAINFIKTQMENNLQAQAKNLDSKQNLLRANLTQFGNMREAAQMTRIMQNDMMSNQLELAAAKAGSPMAKAQLLKAAGELKMESAVKFQEFTKNQSIAKLTAAARQNPEQSDKILAAMDSLDPKKAADMRQLHVPGMGFASSNEGAKTARETLVTMETAKSAIKALRDLNKKSGKSLNPKVIAQADTIRNGLVGALRVPITGPGAMNDGEREMLLRMIPDVTSMMSLDSSNKTRLDTLEQRLDASLSNTLSANGLSVPARLKVPEKRPEIREGDIGTDKNGVQYKRVGNNMVKVK